MNPSPPHKKSLYFHQKLLHFTSAKEMFSPLLFPPINIMELWTVQYTPQLYHKAKHFFLTHGRSDLLTRPPLSVCGRYLISQSFLQRGISHFIPAEGVFQQGTYYFSTSYAGNQIFLAIDTHKIAVDMEKITARDPSLLSSTLTTTREAFYLQRCVKECLVKFLNLPTLEEAFHQTLLLPTNLSEHPQKLLVPYQGKTYHASVKKENGYLFVVLFTPTK
ncbi:MAG: hypothetical protein LBP53_00300 [Candidatus Peribacteria bacterium]|jgi:hypothetical protein|nr:hypothetical protein [Candidatus Peribacteria bacterium]